MNARTRLGLVILPVMLTLASAAGLLTNATAGAHSVASSHPDPLLHCQTLPNYVLYVMDRPASRDGYLVVCFGNPLLRGPIMDFRIER